MTVVDTLSVLDSLVRDVRDAADRWAVELARFGRSDLLAGNGLGGAVVQASLGRIRPPMGAILVSAPTRVDAVLGERLSSIVGLAERGLVDDALASLDRLVAPTPSGGVPISTVGDAVPCSSAQPSPLSNPRGAFRISRMSLLFGLDLTREVRAYAGPLLHVVGERSQLVARRHVVGGPQHRVVVVPGAGMRPHRDRGGETAEHIRRFLDDVVQEGK